MPSGNVVVCPSDSKSQNDRPGLWLTLDMFDFFEDEERKITLFFLILEEIRKLKYNRIWMQMNMRDDQILYLVTN